MTLMLFGLSKSLWFAYLARALSGMFASAVLPVTSAYVADSSSRDRRARRFAWMSTASLLGFLAGPALGGWLANLAMAVGLSLLPGAADFGVLLFLVGLVSASAGILIPMLAYRVSLDAGTTQGTAFGKQIATASLGQALGSATGGWLFGMASHAAFGLTAGLLVIGAMIGLSVGRGLPQPTEG